PDSPEAVPQSPIQTPPVPQEEDEREPMFIQPHDPDYVPRPMYPEYIPLEEEHVLPAKEQPLPPVVSPTAESPEYVAESNPEEDPKEYEDDETEDGPDEDGEEEEEEEHLAPAESAFVIPTDELVSPLEGTKPVIPPPCTDTTTTRARINVRLQAAISLPPEAETLRLASTQALIDVVTVLIPSPPLPPPLYIPPPVDRRDDIPKIEIPPHKRLCLPTLGSRYKIRERDSSTRGRGVDYGFANTIEAEMRHRSIREVGYGIRDTWIDPEEAVLEMSPTTLKKVNTRVTELAELHEHDTQDLYALLEAAQDDYGFVSTLDTKARRLGIREVRYGIRDTWVDPADTVPEIAAMTVGEVNTRVTKLAELHEHDTQDLYALLEDTLDSRTRISRRVAMDSQRVDLLMEDMIIETLRVMGDIRREMGDMQAELSALREQPRRARHPREDARVPNHQDAPRDADSHI
nr:hypothetical protein [Tanacetum cinerariifolium]